MPGIIGRKVGMTSIYSAEGKALPCTSDRGWSLCCDSGQNTRQRWLRSCSAWVWRVRKRKNTPNALKGHFKKAKTSPKSKLVEF
jgi:large subunit ribosomal protein L3